MHFTGNQMVQGPKDSFSANYSKGWTVWLPVKCIIWRKILECFHQKP